MRIETKNLSFSYSEKSKALAVHALNNVSIHINEGEFFGIIGQTGSGKSTFIQHLNGLIKLQKNHGSITVGEFDLGDKKCNFKALRARLGMVFQYPEAQLFAETVEDDVAFGLKNFFPNISDSEIKEKVKEALELVGLNYYEIKDKSPFELSGGQKRRVAIAGVIVTRPEILVLDEPVAGLDPKGKTELTELLHKLHHSVVKTIIIVSHDMNFVAENCTNVAVLNNGKLHAYGLPKQVFNRACGVENMGLDVPLVAKITYALGEEFDNDFTVDGLVTVIAQKLGGERS